MLRTALYSWLLILKAASSAGAYVQQRDCFSRLAGLEAPSAQPLFEPNGLRAAVSRVDGATFLDLDLSVYSDSISCEQFHAQNVSMGLTMSTLGRHHHYSGDSINVTCFKSESVLLANQLNDRIHAHYRVDRLHLLDTFDLTVDLRRPDGQLLSCVNAPLTPDIGPTVSQLGLWGPIGVFAIVVVVALLHELADVSLVGGTLESNGDGETRSRVHLTRIADCLSYTQFIFFSAALSLRYPGFLQPVACRSSWATLMLPAAPIIKTTLYQGVQDGIYEVNGTFGGTPGLELMTQVMGAPVTINTWTNIASLALMVIGFLFAVVQIGQRLESTRDWFTATERLTLNTRKACSLKLTFWIVLRLFISYLMLPLVAWTTYQLDHAAFFPIFYTTLTTLVLCLVLLSFWWGIRQTSPSELGYFILDNSIQIQEQGHRPRSQDVYATATFLLLFVRGAAIGGLQVVGQAQLSILIACELFQVVIVAWMQHSSSVSVRTLVTAGSKLVILLLCTGFLPGVASHETRVALGYAILPIHAAVLLVIFLIPSVYEAVHLPRILWRNSWSDTAPQHEETPQIYNFRQLKRRPNASTNLSIHSQQDLQNMLLMSPVPASSTPSPTLPSSPRDTSLDKPVSYFRPPRQRESSRLWTPSQEQTAHFNHSPSSSGDTLRPGSSDGSVTFASEAGVADSTVELRPSSTPAVDYSFREADLYYGRPRRLSFGQADASPPPTRSSSLLDRLTLAFGSRPKSAASQ